MRRFIVVVGLVLFLFTGGWLLTNKEKISGPADLFRLAGQQISRLAGGASPQYAPWRSSTTKVIRIGSFNTHRFNVAKMKDQKIARIMAEVIRHFDAIAIQEIETQDLFALKRFIRLVNATGRDFRFVLGEQQSGIAKDQQGAILYDASTLELEDNQYYHVGDPGNVLTRDPLVAWFRVRSSAADPFTFSLVNVHLQSDASTSEKLHISEIYNAVKNDGRQEDDVILAGDFGVNALELNQLALSHGLQAANADHKTDTQGTVQVDNFLLDPLGTSEFTGETGVFDFLKMYNLSLSEAMMVSDHLPVWAEFVVQENGAVDLFAKTNRSKTR